MVICDLNMPVMDGYQFSKKTKLYFDNKNNFFNS